MLCFVMLSVGATFAADNATDAVAIDNEVLIDEPLAVEQDVQKVSANESAVVVTPSTIDQYISSSGQLYENVTASEIKFDGTFNNLNLTVERSIDLTGGIFNNPNFEIYSSDVLLSNFTIIQEKGVNSIFVAGSEENHTSDVVIDNVNIVFEDDQSGAGAIPIEVMYSDDFILMNSYIAYGGRTNGYYTNNAVRLTNSKNAIIFNNTIFANLVSAAVGWAEEPAGSGNWVSSPMSEAIVIKNSNGTVFDANLINVTYGNVSGAYDTIYTVDVSGSNGVLVTNNEIISDGNTYIYGIIISGDDFTIRGNNITSTGVFYANGIDIEGPATGVVENNNIDVKAETSAYAIYSGMNGQNVSANYTGNNITGKSYNIFGFSIGDVESNVKENYVNLEGNYTTGIAARTSDLNIDGNKIVLTSSEEGNESIWEGFGVEAVGIKVIKGNAYIQNSTIATPGKGIHVEGNETTVLLIGNFINVVANEDQNAYAIFAIDAANMFVNLNTIDYQGATNGTGVNNAVYVNNVTETSIIANNFTLDLVSSYVPWFEIPAGSGNWASSPISEGIVVEDTDNPVFSLNNVNVTYGGVVGDYDTIYVVDVKADNADISDNEINAKGHTYIYGIIISGENFTIEANNITTESDIYYANGIDIEGPATGVVKDNGIIAKGITSAYPIYSGMNGQNVSVNYTGNDIVGDAYLVIGMSLGDVESNIADSGITVTGNYTTGIAYRGTKLTVDNTLVSSMGSNVGEESVWESFGVETAGIKVVQGNSTITNNHVETTAFYAVDVKDTNSSVHDNYLVGATTYGDASVINDNAEVYNNTPKTTSAVITITEVDGNCNVTGLLTDSEGNPYGNETINYSFNGVNATVTTDENGVFKISDLTNGKLDLSYDGKFYMAPTNTSITLKDIAPVREATKFNVTEGKSIETYAVDFPAGERGKVFKFQLTDANGNPITNASVQFAYKTVIFNRTTDENGIVVLGVSTQFADSYLCALSYLGDETHEAAFVAFNFKLDKKPISISAAAKSYKASTKTKKYTVTLKTKKCASKDGKVYLNKGKKVTLKVNGKTYSGKTNAKGQVTFKITNLKKKGKFTALIKFAGDKTYKCASKKVTLTIK